MLFFNPSRFQAGSGHEIVRSSSCDVPLAFVPRVRQPVQLTNPDRAQHRRFHRGGGGGGGRFLFGRLQGAPFPLPFGVLGQPQLVLLVRFGGPLLAHPFGVFGQPLEPGRFAFTAESSLGLGQIRTGASALMVGVAAAAGAVGCDRWGGV
uniref:(northern house mosquito) hypothetical protein n=1 Tax=Culex pipiens TaxID=7175 RepID=A0A8D8HYK9_CULPI